MLDLARLRADTPGAHDVVHFNNAGASLMPRIVIDTVLEHVHQEAHLGGYEAASAAAERLERVYVSVARLLNAQPDEIAVIENATRAWDMAFYSLPLSEGVWFLLDACQGAGHAPLDVKKIGCHMLAATSRKYLRGPRGMGFLYIERALCATWYTPRSMPTTRTKTSTRSCKRCR